MTRTAMAVLCFAALALPTDVTAQGTRLLRDPDVGPDHIAFVHANDIWLVGRDGGDARRLTSGEGAETDPTFSRTGSGSPSRGSTVATPTCTWWRPTAASPSASRGTPGTTWFRDGPPMAS